MYLRFVTNNKDLFLVILSIFFIWKYSYNSDYIEITALHKNINKRLFRNKLMQNYIIE